MRSWWVLIASLGMGCSGDGVPAPSPTPSSTGYDPAAVEARLLEFEEAERSRVDFTSLARADSGHGPDPYRVVSLGEGRYLGLLRSARQLQVLDERGRVLSQRSVPTNPTSVALVPGDTGITIVVGTELGGALHRYRLAGVELQEVAAWELPGVVAPRAVANLGAHVFVGEEGGGRIHRLDSVSGVSSGEVATCSGPVQLWATAGHLVAQCLHDRSIDIYPVSSQGQLGERARIQHAGPLWGASPVEDATGDVWVAVGGVEDHALDRSIGSFGNVDSFVWVYRLHEGSLERVSESNVSEHGLVTPKALSLELGSGSGAELHVFGYGSGKWLQLGWPSAPTAAPSVEARDIAPGVAAVARAGDGFLLGNPLLDAWSHLASDGQESFQAVAQAAETRHTETRVGEALFFTTLMAPANSSEGKLSRFTCETCHFEGYGDGRVHFTGRGTVHATTKPLLSLFSNRPHFSRALDPHMARMVINEFRVAGANSGTDPWFDIAVSDFPWLEQLGVGETTLGAEQLRRSLMRFLMKFNHRPNAYAHAKKSLDETETRGMELFAQHCESCHAAQLLADDAGSRVEREKWSQLVLSPQAPLVWGSAPYQKTGIEPYVHEDGARTPSLRRLYKKRPYFTNGSASSLSEVLLGARVGSGGFLHHGDAEGLEPLADDEREALLAWLRLL